jgi:hypothetical protein
LNCGGSSIVVLKKVARNANPIQKGKRGLHVGDLIHIKGIKIDGEEHDRLHADHASSSYGQRDGGRIRVVRHVKDEISGVFAEGPSIMLAYMLSEHPITP